MLTEQDKARERATLEAASEQELFEYCEQYIWLSAYAANNPYSDYHWKCDAGYAECARRGRVDLYKQAHARARRSAGC